MRRAWFQLSLLVLAGIAQGGGAQSDARRPLLGDVPSGSRARPVHLLTLRDENGDAIVPNDRMPLPFSSEQTCGGTCHDVRAIRQGWHFNATQAGVRAGRNGEPWLWVDQATATQIPLSYRNWPGTYRPREIGVGARAFAIRFGARTPAPMEGDGADSARDRERWDVSGKLEANCLACHDRSPMYDQAEYARQLRLENFRYAATAASGLAAVTGSSREMPNLFDYLLPGSVEDSLRSSIPQLHYGVERFQAGQKAPFDIARQAESNRCYACHTVIEAAVAGKERWKAGEDVHLARGMRCVQCHSNGLNHKITRDYEGDPEAEGDAFAALLTCRGCHMGGADGKLAAGPHGMNAPYPQHKGLPAIHLEKLSCTFCHAGPVLAGRTGFERSSRAHGLGEHDANLSPEALPHIVAPVYAQQGDGKLTPYRAVWPAFWGRMQAGRVEPLNLQAVRSVLESKKLNRAAPANGDWPKVDVAWVGQVLALLKQSGNGSLEAVYIAGGKLYRMNDAGAVKAEENPQAQPYLWPIGHDVRPASQALGANGCQDCHAKNSPVFFGSVAVDSPLEQNGAWSMNRFQPGIDAAYHARLAESWKFRPWLKAIGGVTVLALLVMLLGGAYQFLRGVSSRIAKGR